MHDEQYYVNKGQSQPRNGLLEQADVTAGLAVQYQPQLVARGFGEERIAQFATEKKILETTIEDQETSRGAHGAKGESEVTARAHAKDYVADLREVAPIVVRDHPTPGITVESFLPGERIGSSTARLKGYLIRLRGPVGVMDEHLTKFFDGKSAKARLEELYAELSDSNVGQELSLTNLPDNTRKVYAAKGRLLELIEDCNRIGRVAFRGQPEIRAKFNKDILLRARKTRTVKPEPAPAPAPEVKPEPEPEPKPK